MNSTLSMRLAESFGEENFLRKLAMSRSDLNRRFGAVDWNRVLYPLTPVRTRISCAGTYW